MERHRSLASKILLTTATLTVASGLLVTPQVQAGECNGPINRDDFDDYHVAICKNSDGIITVQGKDMPIHHLPDRITDIKRVWAINDKRINYIFYPSKNEPLIEIFTMDLETGWVGVYEIMY